MSMLKVGDRVRVLSKDDLTKAGARPGMLEYSGQIMQVEYLYNDSIDGVYFRLSDDIEGWKWKLDMVEKLEPVTMELIVNSFTPHPFHVTYENMYNELSTYSKIRLLRAKEQELQYMFSLLSEDEKLIAKGEVME